jgi:hypothetical protein
MTYKEVMKLIQSWKSTIKNWELLMKKITLNKKKIKRIKQRRNKRRKGNQVKIKWKAANPRY